EECLRLCGLMPRFWCTRGYLSEGREWCERALRMPVGVKRTWERANVLNGAGNLAFYLSEYASARTYLEESISIQREIGNPKGIADALSNLGNVALFQGSYVAARTYFDESLSIRREIGDRRGIASSLGSLGNVEYHQSNYSE